ncbi:acid protease, partial [Aureobasidium melanogenum]
MTSSSISTSATAIPSPFSFAPSQYWDGNDGSWSSFMVRIGTPPQDFRVFPSTTGQETLIPVPEGCTQDDPANCGSLRGVMPFQGDADTGFLSNASTTWTDIGVYTTDLETNLGINANGAYGFDTVGLQVENSGGIQQTHQVVAGIADKSFMYGVFGLGPKPSNFSVLSDPQPSFLTSLRENNTIPSKSYAYTAGASYRYSKVLGSLTLGGYDASRMNGNGTVFPFASDDSRPLQVGVTQITARNTLLGTATLYSTGYFSLVDSTLPHIWMPQAACDNFASNFGLNYDNQTDLYLINDTIHTKLQQLNPTIIFQLSPETTDGGPSTNIVLPYSAFDLQASYPYYTNGTRYFPIRRAANNTQYVLGRTFLQEAYLIADYERNNFTITQAAFANPMPAQNIISILPPGVNATNSTGGGDGVVTRPSPILSRNVIIGIAVGVVAGAALVLFIFGTIFYVRRRRRQRDAQALLTHKPDSDDPTPSPPPAEVDAAVKLELPSDSEAALNEMPTGTEKYGWHAHEVQGSKVQPRVEMRGGWEPPELDGRSLKDGTRGGVYELQGSEPLQQPLREGARQDGQAAPEPFVLDSDQSTQQSFADSCNSEASGDACIPEHNMADPSERGKSLDQVAAELEELEKRVDELEVSSPSGSHGLSMRAQIQDGVEKEAASIADSRAEDHHEEQTQMLQTKFKELESQHRAQKSDCPACPILYAQIAQLENNLHDQENKTKFLEAEAVVRESQAEYFLEELRQRLQNRIDELESQNARPFHPPNYCDNCDFVSSKLYKARQKSNEFEEKMIRAEDKLRGHYYEVDKGRDELYKVLGDLGEAEREIERLRSENDRLRAAARGGRASKL